MNTKSRANTSHGPFAATAGLMILAAVFAISIDASSDVATGGPESLTARELEILGIWQGAENPDGSVNYLAFHSDRTAVAWAEPDDPAASRRSFVRWELDETTRGHNFAILLAEEVSPDVVRLIDAHWAPDEALSLAGSEIMVGPDGARRLIRVAPETILASN